MGGRDSQSYTDTVAERISARTARGIHLALTARQVGKTTVAAWAIAHAMLFRPGSLSVIACPAQRQSGEAVRRVRAVLEQTGVTFKSVNVYGLEVSNGSRVLALPSSDDSIRGLTVDAWIVADEAARLTDDLIAALRPMRARRPQTRLAMLSTAWSCTDPFWQAWDSDDPSWMRLKATIDSDPTLLPADHLQQERRSVAMLDDELSKSRAASLRPASNRHSGGSTTAYRKHSNDCGSINDHFGNPRSS